MSVNSLPSTEQLLRVSFSMNRPKDDPNNQRYLDGYEFVTLTDFATGQTPNPRRAIIGRHKDIGTANRRYKKLEAAYTRAAIGSSSPVIWQETVNECRKVGWDGVSAH